MIPFNIYIQLWVKPISVYAWKYCTDHYSELLEIMDTQWGISRSVTSANLIWAMQCLTASAVPRTAWNLSWNKCPGTTSLRRIPHPSSPHSAKQGGKAWKRLARKTLVAWDQNHKICIPIDVRPSSNATQGCKSCKVATVTAVFSGNHCKTFFGNLG